MPKASPKQSPQHIVEAKKPNLQHSVESPEGKSADPAVINKTGLKAQNKPAPKGTKKDVFSEGGYRISNHTPT